MTAHLHIQLDERSGVPVYRQMMDQVRYYVAAGTLRPGDQLPSIRELASALAVNPTTVVKAYTELEREGVIEMHHGRGAFISSKSISLSPEEREQKLRRSTRQMVVEGIQLRVPVPRIIELVREELASLDSEQSPSEGQPIRFRVISGG